MTINFKNLLQVNDKLTLDDACNILQKYDEVFYKGWLIYNERIYGENKDEYILSLPAKDIDVISYMMRIH